MRKPIIGSVKSSISAHILFLKIRSSLLILRLMMKIYPPDRVTCEQMLILLKDLQIKLGVNDV